MLTEAAVVFKLKGEGERYSTRLREVKIDSQGEKSLRMRKSRNTELQDVVVVQQQLWKQ